MTKLLFGLFCTGSMLSATVTDIEVTPKLINETKLKIIDIRTESEWVRHGVIEDAFLLTFFNKFRSYDIDIFIKELDRIIDQGEKFAIIDQVGGRTQLLSNLLGKEMDYKVVILKGGMKQLIDKGYKPTFPSLSIPEN